MACRRRVRALHSRRAAAVPPGLNQAHRVTFAHAGSRPAPIVTTPVADDADQRLYALDILRGCALFGMILVHFHQKMRLDATGIEDLIGWIVWIGIEQKAWGTFAILFGVGFAILLRRLELRRQPVTAIFLRRMAGLALFGIIAEVGFGFHILFTYACWGAVLLLVRRWSTRALLVTAGLAAAARPVAAELAALRAWVLNIPLSPSAGRALAQAADAAAQHGNYLDLLAARWQLFLGTHPGGWSGFLPDVNFALFVIGLLAVRHRVFDEPKRHAKLIAGWMTFGAASWLAYWIFLRHLEDLPIPGVGWPLATGLGLVQEQWLSFTYVGAVVLLLAWRPAWTTRLSFVGRAGRMALTNYMIQAITLDVLSSGYGAGLKLRPYDYVVAAILLFGLEALFSSAWLARFRFGPLEWAWRTLTYARRQPLRRSAEPAARLFTPSES